MKIYKTKKGYYYKEYKNGKKKRISKIEYDKLRKKSNKKQKGGRCFHNKIIMTNQTYKTYVTEYTYKCQNPLCGETFKTMDDMSNFEKHLSNEKQAILNEEEKEKKKTPTYRY